MKKKIAVLVLCVCMLAIAIAGGTMAYFTDEDEKTNTFTVGNVSIVLNEPNWDAEGAAEAQNAYPGQIIAKDPTVTNDGKNPCFVRVSVTGLDQFAELYGDEGWIAYLTDGEAGQLGENWVEYSDGYFYCTKVLPAGETTDALFDQIQLPFVLENDEQTQPIVVTAYAVQAQGALEDFAQVQNMTVDQIAQWMDQCMGTEQN